MMARVANLDKPLLVAVALLALMLLENAAPGARFIVARDDGCEAADGICPADRRDNLDEADTLVDSVAIIEGGFTSRTSDAP